MTVNIKAGESLTETGNNILTEMISGNVAPDVGAALLNGLASQTKLVESVELAERLERVEELVEGKK